MTKTIKTITLLALLGVAACLPMDDAGTDTQALSVPGQHAEYVPATAGNAGHGGQATGWVMSTGVVTGGSYVFDWVVPVTATAGDMMSVRGEFQTTNAVAGGFVNLLFVDRITGVASIAGSTPIPASFAVQSVSIATNKVALYGYYTVQFNFAGGHGGVKIFGVEKLWTPRGDN
jgi:hypothetical protein